MKTTISLSPKSRFTQTAGRFILIASCFLFSSFIHYRSNSAFKVKISSIRSADGYIQVLLFNQPAGFPTNPKKAYKHLKEKASRGELIIPAGDIPYGTYSIVVFHDKNANEELDKSWFGSPKEDYGFSNIPGEFCGTPSFQQTSFTVNQPVGSISVKLMNTN